MECLSVKFLPTRRGNERCTVSSEWTRSLCPRTSVFSAPCVNGAGVGGRNYFLMVEVRDHLLATFMISCMMWTQPLLRLEVLTRSLPCSRQFPLMLIGSHHPRVHVLPRLGHCLSFVSVLRGYVALKSQTTPKCQKLTT